MPIPETIYQHTIKQTWADTVEGESIGHAEWGGEVACRWWFGEGGIRAIQKCN